MNDPRTLRQASQRFAQKSDLLASISFFATLVAYFSALISAAQLGLSNLWSLPLVIIGAFAMIRLYVLQHDFGHHSLFSSPWVNDLAGQAVSILTLAPYRAMQYNHNLHHGGIGSLDHRETGEVYTMTLAEWQAAGPWKRLGYRLYRNPFLVLTLGAFLIFAFRYRWPKNAARIGAGQILAHNLAVFAYLYGLYTLFGAQGAWVYLALVSVAGFVGGFLVYMQHNFEDTYWEHMGAREYGTAVLQGSSALDLGHWFDVATANINWHDLHHLNPQIPSYRLRQAHRALREEGLFETRLIGWGEAIAALRLKLWDEDAKRLVPFPGRAFGATAHP